MELGSLVWARVRLFRETLGTGSRTKLWRFILKLDGGWCLLIHDLGMVGFVDFGSFSWSDFEGIGVLLRLCTILPLLCVCEDMFDR